MVKVTTVAAGTGKKLLRFGFLLKSSLFFFIILIVFSNAVVLSVQQRDVSIFLNDIGGRLLFSTVELGRASEELITREGVFDFSQGFFRGLWVAFLDLSDLFSSMIIIYFWIKFFAFLVGSSFISNTSQRFINISIALIAFFIIQIILILIFFSQGSTLFGVEFQDSAVVNLSLPFKSFWSFIKVIPILLSPISDKVGDLVGTNLNQTILNNST